MQYLNKSNQTIKTFARIQPCALTCNELKYSFGLCVNRECVLEILCVANDNY